LAGLGLPPESPERIRRTIGLSLAATLVELKGADTARLADAFERLFIARADDVMVERTALYPWVPDMVVSLTASGITLGIVSTKFRRRIEAVLEREGLAERFAVIVGGEDVIAPKPASEGLLLALRTLGIPPTGALYVGDSTADGEAARSAGVPFVAVRSGVTPSAALASLSPVAILNDASELPALIGAG
jgi:phosphoglycolate phosphatase